MVRNINVEDLELKVCAVEDLIAIRERTLSSGHPGRPVVWQYDEFDSSTHLAAVIEGQIVGCVSSHDEPLDGFDGLARRFHSMGVDESWQNQGIGGLMLRRVAEDALSRDIDALWATARESALTFYIKHGLLGGSERVVPETGFRVFLVYATRKEMSLIVG